MLIRLKAGAGLPWWCSAFARVENLGASGDRSWPSGRVWRLMAGRRVVNPWPLDRCEYVSNRRDRLDRKRVGAAAADSPQIVGEGLSGVPTINRETSTLLVVDFQSRLMPAIDDGTSIMRNARRLLDAAEMLQVPIIYTEQNAGGLGNTVPELRSDTGRIVHKMTFDACRTPGFLEAFPDRRDIIVSGCEAHVCVLQTVLGLLNAGRHVYVARDALGSRRSESKETAIRRMERNGAEVVTTEMVAFEWLETANDPRLHGVLALVK